MDEQSASTSSTTPKVDVCVGTIGKPHGVTGSTYVLSTTDVPDDRFASGTQMHTPSGRTLTVAQHRWHGKYLLVEWEGIQTREAAEALRGEDLYTLIDADASTGEDDEYFTWQLVGCQVVDPSGEPWGTIVQVINLPGHDVLEVEEGHETLLVPFVEKFVPRVTLDTRTVVIKRADLHAED